MVYNFQITRWKKNGMRNIGKNKQRKKSQKMQRKSTKKGRKM